MNMNGLAGNSKKELEIKNSASVSLDKKNEITHTEFMNFLEPFFEIIDEKKYERLKSETTIKEFHFSEEFYKKFASILKDRLCSCYIFDEDFEIEDINFEKELEFKDEPSLRSESCEFMRKYNILDDFKTLQHLSVDREYRDQINKNNNNKKIMLEALNERIKVTSYFHGFEIIHKEIENIYRKYKTKRKKFTLDLDDEMLKEYLNRMEEYFQLFGDCEQFADDEMNYQNVLKEEDLEDLKDKFEYLP